ncbi:hypothetical protein [Arenibaculum pallidiluteum]|uniref:hypothetical protein n=1 Tax=Arenibaculum pallidiluteum TaxID=2812559 RepID=UPI001A972D67|nr:hypothetical protein [Arenibaculum pallidiluteum]
MKIGHHQRIADELLREHGPCALSLSQHWADKAAQADQRGAARFWRKIAAMVLTRLGRNDDFRRDAAAVVNMALGRGAKAGTPPNA